MIFLKFNHHQKDQIACNDRVKLWSSLVSCEKVLKTNEDAEL